MSDTLSFSDALCEVRKAHRLLWSFYDRLIPACHALMKEFAPASFYASDFSSFGNRGSNPLNYSSSYPALPLLDLAVLYGYDRNNPDNPSWHDNPTPGDYLLVLSLHLDSAFREYDFSNAPDDLGIESKNFPLPETSETRVLLSTVYCQKKVNSWNWLHGVYNSGDWEYTLDELQFFNRDEPKATAVEEADFLAYVKQLDIEKDFASQEAIKNAAEDYRKLIEQKIPAIHWGNKG